MKPGGAWVLLVVAFAASPTRAQEGWWDPAFGCRVPVDVGAGGYARADMPVEVDVDFTGWLSALANPSPFDPNSVRVVDGASNQPVPFQFDPAEDFDPGSNARGQVVFIAGGPLDVGISRRFHIYFDAGTQHSPPVVTELVGVTDGILHEGQESFRVATQNATFFYQKQGAGFASLEDHDGNDWISFHPEPGSGSAGEYRGIPNLGEWAHPGYDNAASTLVRSGPVRARIHSETIDQAWEDRWDFFPAYARLTITRSGGTYWFLYEGTPGGNLDPADYCVRSSGERTDIGTDWQGDLPEPEWAYFGDSSLGRILFLVHHEDDSHPDQFWQMENNMTVFGFGREYRCCGRYLTEAPARFTVGLADVVDQAAATARIDAAFRPLAITLGQPEAFPEAADGGGLDGSDAGADASADAGGDAGSDAGLDSGQDSGADDESDAGSAPGADVPGGAGMRGGCACGSGRGMDPVWLLVWVLVPASGRRVKSGV